MVFESTRWTPVQFGPLFSPMGRDGAAAADEVLPDGSASSRKSSPHVIYEWLCNGGW